MVQECSVGMGFARTPVMNCEAVANIRLFNRFEKSTGD
jgi:hypothetical protein